MRDWGFNIHILGEHINSVHSTHTWYRNLSRWVYEITSESGLLPLSTSQRKPLLQSFPSTDTNIYEGRVHIPLGMNTCSHICRVYVLVLMGSDIPYCSAFCFFFSFFFCILFFQFMTHPRQLSNSIHMDLFYYFKELLRFIVGIIIHWRILGYSHYFCLCYLLNILKQG